MITLRLPAVFAYRDLVTRAVATGCKVASQDAGADDSQAEDLSNAMVSAVGEAFNNVVDHAYESRGDGDVTIVIDSNDDHLTVTMTDDGRPFDIAAVPEPDLAALPESGMGLYIMRSFVDDLAYAPGPPNVLTMRKKTR